MHMELVKVVNGGEGGAIRLDLEALLSETRSNLQEHQLMTPDQAFMFSGVPVEQSDEASTQLGEVVGGLHAEGPPVLIVGHGSVNVGQGPEESTKMWNLMDPAQKVMIMNTLVQIDHGLSLSENDGAFKSTHKAIEPLHVKNLPSSMVPRIVSQVKTDAYFSKYAESLATSNSNGGSLSVSTPWGGGSASYTHAESRSKSSSSVKTWFAGTYSVNKVVAELDIKQLKISADFHNELLTAAKLKRNEDAFVGIVQALNKYGWYVPIKMTLGGLLYASRTTSVSSWSEAESSSNEFGADFKASFDGIGGGAAFKHSDSSESSRSGSTGSANLSFTAIGGDPSVSNDYEKWAKSLEKAIAWNVSGYEKMQPSVALLMNETAAGKNGPALATYIHNLIANEYANSMSLHELQPVIDCGSYSMQLGSLIGQWG